VVGSSGKGKAPAFDIEPQPLSHVRSGAVLCFSFFPSQPQLAGSGMQRPRAAAASEHSAAVGLGPICLYTRVHQAFVHMHHFVHIHPDRYGSPNSPKRKKIDRRSERAHARESERASERERTSARERENECERDGEIESESESESETERETERAGGGGVPGGIDRGGAVKRGEASAAANLFLVVQGAAAFATLLLEL